MLPPPTSEGERPASAPSLISDNRGRNDRQCMLDECLVEQSRLQPTPVMAVEFDYSLFPSFHDMVALVAWLPAEVVSGSRPKRRGFSSDVLRE